MHLTDEEGAVINGSSGPIRVPTIAHIVADTESLSETGAAYFEEPAAADWGEYKVVFPMITDPRGANFKAYDRIRHDRDTGACICSNSVIGERMGSYFEVPKVEGVGAANSDQLKHFGATIAPCGSTALYYIAGLTPEANDALDVVVFAAPQLSLMKLGELAGLFEGRNLADGITLTATINPEMKSAADRMDMIKRIEDAGGILHEGVCFYQMHARELAEANGWHCLMPNSAKLINNIAGNGYAPMAANLARRVDSTIAGRVA